MFQKPSSPKLLDSISDGRIRRASPNRKIRNRIKGIILHPLRQIYHRSRSRKLFHLFYEGTRCNVDLILDGCDSAHAVQGANLPPAFRMPCDVQVGEDTGFGVGRVPDGVFTRLYARMGQLR